jgi:uncharacterized membrane-anchored protein YitT (DUF2179 family)
VIGAVTSRLRGLTPQRVLRHRPVREFLWMTGGILLTAWGLDSFLIPNKIAAGGVSGLSTIIYHLLKENGFPTLPVGTLMLLFNAVLLLVAWRIAGTKYAAKTIYGTVGLSVAVDLIATRAPALASDNLLLAALYGGATTGIGLGMVFKAGGNTGGTDIVAQLMSRRVPLAVGQLMLLIDAAITITAGFAFGLNYALYAAVAIVVGGASIDLVLEGPVVEKAAWIISDRAEAIGTAINDELKRGATAIAATGVYTGEPRGMLYVVVSRREIDDLKHLVAAIDPSAFMVLSDVHEAIGEGFRQFDAAQ